MTGSDDKTANIWDVRTGQLLADLREHSGPVTQAFFSPDSTRLTTLGVDSVINVWDTSPDTRTTQQVSDYVRQNVPYRLRDGALVPCTDEQGNLRAPCP